MDPIRFDHARRAVLSSDKRQTGIGTLGEKTVHAVLKRYYEPNEACHEVPCGTFVADVLSDGHIFEIQSRAFERLLPKLGSFLEQYDVTVVFPVAVRKEISWIDPATGECSKPRVSNKHGHVLDLFPELYRIRSLLAHPHLHFRVVLLNVSEHRLLDGEGRDLKKRATKMRLIPEELLGEISVDSCEELLTLLPCRESLPHTFTAEGLARLSGASLRSAGMTLRVLRELRLVECVGKEKRKYLYSLLKQNS